MLNTEKENIIKISEIEDKLNFIASEISQIYSLQKIIYEIYYYSDELISKNDIGNIIEIAFDKQLKIKKMFSELLYQLNI